MVSVPGLLLASKIACLNEPAPESLVLVTVKVAARTNDGKAIAASENTTYKPFHALPSPPISLRLQ